MEIKEFNPPVDLPDLSAAKIIAVDCETYDPDLMKKGPGGVRNRGRLVGVSIAVDQWSEYFPLFHSGGDNVKNPKAVISWLNRELGRSDQPKVGANILYDLEWLQASGILIKGPKFDVQVAAALLDESRKTYKLDSLGLDYLGEQKDEALLNWATTNILNTDLEKAKGSLYLLPGRYVAPYGRQDAALTLRIHQHQEPLIKKEDLENVYRLESKLIDVLHAMRFQGVRVDVEKARCLATSFSEKEDDAKRKLRRLCGFEPNVWANEDLVKVCEKLGYPYNKTAKGSPSFPADWLESQTPEVFGLIVACRKLNRAGAVFIKSKIIDMEINGRIHPQYHPTRKDDYGSVSGRLSSSNPNMQQIPARDKEIAPLVRSLFIPEDGEQWLVADYSQQEPRVTVHYAEALRLDGAKAAGDQYRNDPSTDFHQMVADLAAIDRKPAKTINLGLEYGMGKKALRQRLGLTYDEAEALFSKYHAAVPYIQQLAKRCSAAAARRGYVRTLYGRRRRFNLWGPTKWSPTAEALPHDLALEKYGPPVTRYFLHKALNGIVQGSSADMIKQAMVDCYAEGLLPLVTVHDELDFSNQDNSHIARIKEIMLGAVKLSVPLKVDIEIGPSWGEAKKI